MAIDESHFCMSNMRKVLKNVLDYNVLAGSEVMNICCFHT